MSPRAWAAFATMSILWGIPYLFIKVAVDDGVPPGFVAWARVLLAACVLLPLAWHARALGALRGRGRWLLAYAVIEISIPFPLIGFGETHVASSTAAIAIATVPLIASLLALRFAPGERLGGRRLVGMLLGFGGVAALVGIDVSGSSGELLGIAALVVAATGYACGPLIISRGLGGLDGRATMGVSLAMAAVVLTPLAALDPPTEVPPTGAIVAIVVLGIVCTAAAFVAFAELVRTAGPSRSVIITYVNPVIALALGVALLDEQPGAGALLGLLLILLGSWLSTDGRLPGPLERRLAGAER
ncbi:DMT family transporter [Conexibacter stalactiti]|uniref:DMT family transporter n=1 Tax=Conexibacter stalactiti TaxID=1940611 RepID=A0ABU4HVT9_9ACTN|nr:DMT family transporter [Conexibacter stalactiti]MDW5597447.1 DMT family transporter [Conexibacter stalactiti]MEC5038089.1 DMT family transporter [Conexibacter stalactiti]